MLGKLARWLRILGYDTELASREKDSELIVRARMEGRILLTRDKSIQGIHLPDGLEDQLVFLAKNLGMKIPSEPQPRYCPACNGELEPIQGGLPEGVDHGWKCRKCGKLYWEGSHWRRMRTFLARVRSRVENELEESA